MSDPASTPRRRDATERVAADQDELVARAHDEDPQTVVSQTYARNRSITAAVSSRRSSWGRSPARSIVTRSRCAVRGDERIRGRGVGEARMVAEEEECRVREPLVGALRSRIVEQPGHERQRSPEGARLLAGPPAVPLVLPRDLLRIREGLPEEPADHLAPSEDREQQPADPRQAQEPVDVPGGSAGIALEAAEPGRTDRGRSGRSAADAPRRQRRHTAPAARVRRHRRTFRPGCRAATRMRSSCSP